MKKIVSLFIVLNNRNSINSHNQLRIVAAKY